MDSEMPARSQQTRSITRRHTTEVVFEFCVKVEDIPGRRPAEAEKTPNLRTGIEGHQQIVQIERKWSTLIDPHSNDLTGAPIPGYETSWLWNFTVWVAEFKIRHPDILEVL
jgi:hypothetical protein